MSPRAHAAELVRIQLRRLVIDAVELEAVLDAQRLLDEPDLVALAEQRADRLALHARALGRVAEELRAELGAMA